MITLGIIGIVVSILLFVTLRVNKEREEYNSKLRQSTNDDYYYNRDRKELLPSLKRGAVYGIFISSLLLLFGAIANPIGRNSYGYRQVVENPISGKTWVQFNQGWYIKGFFSTTTTYPNVVTIVYADEKHAPEEKVSSLNPPLEIRFSDAAPAVAMATVKWRLSSNSKQMLLTHQDNRNANKLTETVLSKYTGECLNYASQVMESETHYSGGKSKMAEDFQSQLEEGQYIIVTKAEYVKDSVSNTSRKMTFTDFRRRKDGTPLRKKSNIKQYGITIVSATIDAVDYHPNIDKKLDAKIDASTRESISKQLAITAEQEAITAKMEGEKLIAKTKAKQEALEQEAVIIARKERKVAEENVLRDKAKAASTLALKRAEAEGDKLKVQAGLSPLEKATIEKETRIAVARELAKVDMPDIVVGGGDGGSGASPMDALGIKMLMDIQEKLSK